MNKHLRAYLAGQSRTLRRNAGLTQEKLAIKIGRTAEAISNIERGKSLPTLETLIALAQALELPLRDFFPSGGFDDNVSQNRLKREAEAMSLLRGLSDKQLQVAITQIRALGNL